MKRKVMPLRVLHLASFAGNIGDVANHAGAYSLFRQYLDFDLVFTELEIREFYWKQRKFDDDFVALANSYDLLMIGGGNYFELWVENSATGTSVDITAARLSALTVPTLFYSLGVDTGQGYTEASAIKFRAFMQTVLARDDMFVSVRNDGSSLALREVLGSSEAERIPVMPDGGFFAARSLGVTRRSDTACRQIGINIAGDMLERRFNRGVTHHDFLEGLAAVCTSLLEEHEDLKIKLMPHIWRDITALSELLPMIPDHHLRRRIAIAGLNPTASGLKNFMQNYQACTLVLGMRFHANVCPFGMCVPTLGLLNYPQIERLYEELDMVDRLLDVRKDRFAEEMNHRIRLDLTAVPALEACCAQGMACLDQMARNVLLSLNAWLSSRKA